MKRFTHLVTSLLAAASAAAFGQSVPPDAGRLLQELPTTPLRPTPAAPRTTIEEPPIAPLVNGRRIAVKGVRISGASAFSEAELLALVADAAGRSLTLVELEALAMRITRHYRDAGYLVARAYLPSQEVKGGVIHIAVLEGRLGTVNVRNEAGVAASALAPLKALAPGEAVHRRAMEGSLLALADLPGVEVKSTLRPGTAVGSSDFLVEVMPGAAFSGSVDLDSFGNRYTGAHRLGTSLFWNNPAALGDQASLRLQKSDGDFDYYRVGYQLPIGSDATRIGVAWSEMSYGLGKDFAVLRANGEASVGSLYLLHPLLRSREANWYAQLQYDDKRLQDRIGATATRIDKTLDNWTLGVNGNFIDGLGGGGSNTLALGYTSGHLGLDPTSDAIDLATARSRGGFSKWSAFFQRTQALPAGYALQVSCSAQWADKNLDSAEKFSLGGAYGVRAYPQGEAAGDEGQLITLELRRPLADRWEVNAFYDDGGVTINRNPWTTAANSRHLAGYGIGATYAGGGMTLRVFAAWKGTADGATSDVDRTPRVWLQATKYF